MFKKLFWLLVLVLVGFGLWKVGVYFYRQMEQEEAKKNQMMERQSQSTAEQYTSPATSGMEHGAQRVRRTLDQVEKREAE